MVTQLNLTLSLRNKTVPCRVGLLLLETDHTTELEFARHMPHDLVGVYANRVTYANPTTPENLRKMVPLLGERAEQILPEADLDVVYYGCTSASFVIGDDVVASEINKAKPTASVVTPTLAALAACHQLRVGSMAILTPYLPETSAPLEPYFTERGISVVKHSCLGIEDDRIMAALNARSLIQAAIEADHPSADALFISCTALRALEVVPELKKRLGKPVITSNQAATEADHPDADALFISCTALRALEVVPELEKRLGKPVITSNQAAIWYILRLLGLPQPVRNSCQLFHTLPEAA